MKQNILNPQLKEYIGKHIIPLYNNFDPAHDITHVTTVISESMQLAQHYDVNINMVYAIAAFHDTGLKGGRELHHVLSAEIIRKNVFLKTLFTKEEIDVMAEAAEDHRASSTHAPRSIYGRIVAEADRIIEPHTIIRRTIQYGLAHYPELKKEEHYQRFLAHMAEKYAEGGYLKLWIPESNNATILQSFRETLKDPIKTKELFEQEWKECKPSAMSEIKGL